MARKIERLIEEQENKSKRQRARELVVEFERTQESLKNLTMKERSTFTLEIVLPLKPLQDPQQCEVTTLREEKNTNGKMNPDTQITGKKARKLSKKKAKLEKLQEATEKTLQRARLQNLNLVGIAEQRRKALRHNEAI
jgi:hypothetical protein